MRIIKLICLLAFLSGCFQAGAQRISGYFPNYNYTASNYLNIQWDKMTHLYYFSLNPTRTAAGQSDGSLWFNDIYSWFTTANFNNVVARARLINPDIKILIVTGGAPGGDTDLNTRLNYIAGNAGRRNTFCNNIINFIKANNLDGWDLDWEFPTTTTEKNNHESLLATMRQKIDSMMLKDCRHYEITIAVGGGYTDRNPKTCWNPAHTDYVNAGIINYVDYVNIMTYDGDIGAAPCSFASHQHYDMVVKALGDWRANFPAWPVSKFQIGVGFYNNSHTAFNSNGNNSTWYNQTYWATGGSGCPNMQSKINYAEAEGTAGIFIWEITQDNLCSGTVPTCYSLLDCIYQYTVSNWGVYDYPESPCTMPVALTSFTGKTLGDYKLIQWTTSEEIDHDYFVLERSADGISFEEAARIESGNNSISGSSYSFYDDHTEAFYYRLKIISLSGEQEYSHVIRVGREASYLLKISPNPSQNNFLIVLPSDEIAELSIVNASGQEIFSRTNFSERELRIGENWTPGIYFLKIVTQGKTEMMRLVKI